MERSELSREGIRWVSYVRGVFKLEMVFPALRFQDCTTSSESQAQLGREWVGVLIWSWSFAR